MKKQQTFSGVEFCALVASGNLAEIKLAIERGQSPNSKDQIGSYAITYALSAPNPKPVIEFLIERKASLKFFDDPRYLEDIVDYIEARIKTDPTRAQALNELFKVPEISALAKEKKRHPNEIQISLKPTDTGGFEVVVTNTSDSELRLFGNHFFSPFLKLEILDSDSKPIIMTDLTGLGTWPASAVESDFVKISPKGNYIIAKTDISEFLGPEKSANAFKVIIGRWLLSNQVSGGLRPGKYKVTIVLRSKMTSYEDPSSHESKIIKNAWVGTARAEAFAWDFKPKIR